MAIEEERWKSWAKLLKHENQIELGEAFKEKGEIKIQSMDGTWRIKMPSVI